MTDSVAPGGPGDAVSLFARVGGTVFFERVARAFYEGVSGDPLLRPMYPADLAPAERRLALFLQQYWGGPQTYNEERGHPRLRMRHARFVVDESAKRAWLTHMGSALDQVELEAADKKLFVDYFAMAAEHLINS